jgi:hypothetical protein
MMRRKEEERLRRINIAVEAISEYLLYMEQMNSTCEDDRYSYFHLNHFLTKWEPKLAKKGFKLYYRDARSAMHVMQEREFLDQQLYPYKCKILKFH